MSDIVAVDIGGTHARFAIAQIEDGRMVALGEVLTLRTADYPRFDHAWKVFAENTSSPLPSAAAIAVASPAHGDVIHFTNNPWVITRDGLSDRLKVETALIINDFEAVAHAVAQASPEHFLRLCGPGEAFGTGTISIVGPGTGLGVATLHREVRGYRVQATEGGHIGFAPADSVGERVLERLRQRYDRVSAERALSGSGLREFYAAVGNRDSFELGQLDDAALWARALGPQGGLASAALLPFCENLGGFAGDIALAQGGFAGVCIAGGLGLRLRDVLPASRFDSGFRAKGRFEPLMNSIPVKLITQPEPGLFGAAAAFAKEHS